MSTSEAMLQRPAPRWLSSAQGSALAAIGFAWFATVLLLWSTFSDMWRVWGASGTFTHGYLIFPIVVLLLWMRRAEWHAAQPRPGITGFLLIALAAAVWLVGSVLHLNVLMQFGAVGLLVTEVIAIVGWSTFRQFAFPFLFMLLAVPAGEELVPWLMDFTAAFTVKALDFVGIPVYSEGRLIYIPTGNFAVEKACSGVRYLIASIVLGALYAHLHYRTLWRRLLFVGLAAVVPIVANGVRAFMIVMLAHLSDNKIAVGIDHLIYGWIFFGFVMLLVVWLGQLFKEPPPVTSEATGAASAQVAEPGPRSRAVPWVAAVLALLPVAAGVTASRAFQANAEQEAAVMTPAVPAPQPGWMGPLTISGDWTPRFVGPTGEVHAAYLRGTTNVDVVLAYYASERPGAELVNSENQLFDPDGWHWLGERAIEVTLPDGTVLPLREVLVRSGVTTRTIWLALSVHGRPVRGSLDAKWARARDLAAGGPGAGVAMLLSARGTAERPLPEADLREFVVRYYAPLLRCLDHNIGLQGDAARDEAIRCVAAP
jgi:exosortase A